MSIHPASRLLALALAGAVASSMGVSPAQQGAAPPAEENFARREQAYRANNLGVALLEQYQPGEAADAFRRSLAIAPDLGLAQTNLAIALLNVPDPAQAEIEARKAAQLSPQAPQPYYVLGLIARGGNRPEEAQAAFEKVLALDPTDVGTLVNLGQIHLQAGRYAEAVALFRAAQAAEPYNATAVYNLGIALTRVGEREAGQVLLKRFQALREDGSGTLIEQSYPGQGRYAEALASTGSEPPLVERATPAARFVDTTASVLHRSAAEAVVSEPRPLAFGHEPRPGLEPAALAGALVAAFGGDVTAFDFDGDGWLDLYEVGPGGQHVYQNRNGRLVDVTAVSGLDPARGGLGAAAGDYDNDARLDLLVLRRDGVTLHRNDGEGHLSDVTTASGLPRDAWPYLSGAMLDADHDGDLDMFVAGFAEPSSSPAAGSPRIFPDDFAGGRSRLLRNNGNGTFADVAEAAGLARGPAHAVAVVPTDFDNRRDVDLLVLAYGRTPALFRNLRDGTFRDVAAEVGLDRAGRFRCAAAADVNKDGFTDFFFGDADEAGLLALSDGRGRFVMTPGPPETAGATRAQFVDYDNDGLLDLVLLSSRGARLLRNLGDDWVDVTGEALPSAGSESSTSLAQASFAAADFDADGDTDLVLRLRSGALRFWENRGGEHNASLTVRLAGRVSNRSGVGAKIEMRAGSLRQRLETYAATPPPAPADLVLGLGRRASADAVRVIWPAGILQTELTPSATGEATAPAPREARVLSIRELDRKPSSCPFLYAWNGERFEFVTDFMGGGEMGYWQGPGVWNQPDPDEYVRLREDQLHARGGRYELRVTNELEETLFVDRLALVSVAHPAGVEVFPNEGLVAPPRPAFQLHVAREARVPVAAGDERGRDVRDRIARIDRRYVDGFALRPLRGYARQHWLTLDLGALRSDPTLLLLTGWTDYAFSSDNVAAHQLGDQLEPPVVQVQDDSGRWQTVGHVGIPVGRPQTVVFELTGRWQGASRNVRIVTNMRIYWDQILVASGVAPAAPLEPITLDPAVAELRERGFSRATCASRCSARTTCSSSRAPATRSR
jgi:Flp pilus assembly protein TadD